MQKPKELKRQKKKGGTFIYSNAQRGHLLQTTKNVIISKSKATTTHKPTIVTTKKLFNPK